MIDDSQLDAPNLSLSFLFVCVLPLAIVNLIICI